MTEEKWSVPKSLDVCYMEDKTSARCRQYAEKIEKWGHIVFIVVLVVGLIWSLKIAVDTLNVVQEEFDAMHQYMRIRERLKVLASSFVVSAFPWAVSAFAEYFTYRILALILSAIGAIVRNTKVTANVALYNSTVGVKVATAASRTETTSTTTSVKSTVSDSWVCSKCETKNLGTSHFCKDCGNIR